MNNYIPSGKNIKKILMIFFSSLSGYISAQTIELITTPQNTINIQWGKKNRLTGGSCVFQNSPFNGLINSKETDGVILLSASPNQKIKIKADEFAGIFFNPVDDYAKGVALWRYKPWNSWTKPVRIESPNQLPDWDVQFYYWQYTDGVYGAALPISGKGYRTTLGSEKGKWGSKAVSCIDHEQTGEIPALAVAFGKDPYELFRRLYRVSLASMGKGENLQINKKFPEPFGYIGWCTWNSSEMGKLLNEDMLLKGAKSFYDNKFPLGWILIDDGWFQHDGSRLQSMDPDLQKFPNGFKPVVNKLKHDYNLKYVGVWHALNGYWNGIDPNSSLGKQYEKEMFSWTQKEQPELEISAKKVYHFIKPESDSLKSFYERLHRYFRSQDIDFIKVDNQLVTERMAVGNYPIFKLSQSMHRALNESAQKYFKGAIINCMDMTAEAYLNFGATAVARAVEDYFIYDVKEDYNLQKGNAAAHVLQAIYNSIYFSQMVYPDFDMFQSHNPNARYHAIARAINNGPIYITDNIGEQNFDVLRPLIYADGRIIRSETSLLPTEDCLFQIQYPTLFKAFSTTGNSGLLGVWNAADADRVKGNITPMDVKGLKGKQFVLYEHFSGKLRLAKPDTQVEVELPRMGYQLYYVVPVKQNFAPLGLTDKYNAPATILSERWNKNSVRLEVYEGGVFKAYSKTKPLQVKVNDESISNFKFDQQTLEIQIPFTQGGEHPKIEISW